MEIRRDFKKLSHVEKLRFIAAVKRMNTHDATGKPTPGGMYSKYADWHRGERTPIVFGTRKNYDLNIGPISASDTLVSITVDGIVKNFSPGISLTNQSALQRAFEDTVYTTNQAANFIRFVTISISASSVNVDINCTDSAYEFKSIGVEIGRVSQSIEFTVTNTANNFGMTTMQVAHRSPLFLPWHRALLALFEQDLKKADMQVRNAAHSDITLPFWNWSEHKSYDPTSPNGYLWDSNYFGNFSDQNDGKIIDGPFRETEWLLDETKADTRYLRRIRTRDFPSGWSIPSLSLDTNGVYEDGRILTGVRRKIEENMHDGVHVTVGGEGGHMSSVPIAPNDPIFFLHHCNVDRLWSTWQYWTRPNPRVPGSMNAGYTSLIPPAGWRLNEDMEPFKTSGINIKPSDIMNSHNFAPAVHTHVGKGYRYDSASYINPPTP